MKAGMTTVHAVCQSSVIAVITDWYAGVKLCVIFFFTLGPWETREPSYIVTVTLQNG